MHGNSKKAWFGNRRPLPGAITKNRAKSMKPSKEYKLVSQPISREGRSGHQNLPGTR